MTSRRKFPCLARNSLAGTCEAFPEGKEYPMWQAALLG